MLVTQGQGISCNTLFLVPIINVSVKVSCKYK